MTTAAARVASIGNRCRHPGLVIPIRDRDQDRGLAPNHVSIAAREKGGRHGPPTPTPTMLAAHAEGIEDTTKESNTRKARVDAVIGVTAVAAAEVEA